MRSYRTTAPSRTMRRAHQGFVLITALTFVMVLTVLALMAMRGAIFGEKMSGNQRDITIAREAAELALRDAEMDIRGRRFDGVYCAPSGITEASCGGSKRPAGTRPTDAADAGNFWTDVNKVSDGFTETLSSTARPALNGTNVGMYSMSVANDCGRSLWQAAEWNDGTTRRCADGSSYVHTIVYGEFTGAPNTFGSNVRLPRYLIEAYTSADLNITTTSKIFYRITAVGFGRVSDGSNNLASVTLQTIYSP